MSWKDLVSLILAITGVILFLYGANYYDNAVGWTGIGLFVGGFIVYGVLKGYEVLTRKKE